MVVDSSCICNGSVASATVTTLEFNTQQLCQMAVRELDNLMPPVVTEGVARYKVLGTFARPGMRSARHTGVAGCEINCVDVALDSTRPLFQLDHFCTDLWRRASLETGGSYR